MARRATRYTMGLQDNYENPHRGNSFQTSLGSEVVIPAEVHMANHRVMKYQD